MIQSQSARMWPPLAVVTSTGSHAIVLLRSTKGCVLMMGRIWQVPVALANITQRVEFIKQINVFSVPALLRRAMLVDLVKGNRMLLPEMWLAQGFPYPGLAKTYDPTVLEYLEELFPFKDLVIVQHHDTDVEEGD